MPADTPPAELTIMARANLTLEGGQFLAVYEVATVPNTAEVQALIGMEHLVVANADGTFPDLGPVGRMPTQVSGCCGQKKVIY